MSYFVKKITMRRLFLAAFAFCSILLVSCHKDDPVVEKTDYTVVVYGTVGGKMDYLIEGIWAETQQLLPDQKVRVFCVHKYGKEDGFSGHYGQPGEIVAFELTKDTDFEEVASQGAVIKELPLYEPICLTTVLDWAEDAAPANNYVLVLFGHGGGFDANVDYPKDWADENDDVYETKGVLYDEWMESRRAMNMYELTEAIGASKVGHVKGLMFHNCLMGDVQSMTEVAPFTDYIIATPFLMTSEDNPLIPMLVKNLREKSDFEAAARQTVRDSEARMLNGFQHEDPATMNGNVELLKSSEINSIGATVNRLTDRLCELYPTQKAAIDNATNKTYQFYCRKPYFDLLDYAWNLAVETGDAQLRTIGQELEADFGRAILEQVTVDQHVLPALPSYSLSIVITDRNNFNDTIEGKDFTYKQVYDYSDFHTISQWGQWLDLNEQLPTGNPCGQVY